MNTNREVASVERKFLRQAERPSAAGGVPESPIRSAAFRGVMMKLYDYTCAACRLRIITLDGASAVDAAHIIPFSTSHDDGAGNGLAPYKIHHWAFDNGLVSLDDRYKLIVSDSFDEKGPAALLLSTLSDKKLVLLPSQKPFRPALHAVDGTGRTGSKLEIVVGKLSRDRPSFVFMASPLTTALMPIRP